MDLFEGLSQAIHSAQSWAFLGAFLLGCLNGIVFGVLPGLSGSVGIALMIPFTYGMDATAAMGLFVAALAGQTFSGSVAAILLNTPGTSPNAATTFDGYPLARQGRGGFAIGISATASLLGAVVALCVLIALFPVMRTVILAFSFPEFAMLGVLGLVTIAVASRGSMLKGLISGLLGLLVSFVGFAPIGGDVRYVFGQASLFDGVGIVPVLIGLFAIAEALRLLVSNQTVATDVSQLRFGGKQVWEGVGYVFRHPFLVLRSSILGTLIGIVPAVGGTLASFLAYFQAEKTVRNPTFGRGDPRGVLAPEAANNAKDGGSALPSLAFGIPGSADWAIILGAMIVHGVTPGPNLIRDAPDVVWIAILSILGAAFVASAVGIFTAPSLIQVTRIRPSLLAPVVVVLAVVGAFGLNMAQVDVLIAVGFGLLGYAMKSIGMPAIPLILGIILGPIVERSYLQTLSTFGGLSCFVTRPISLALVILTVGILVYEVVNARRTRKNSSGSVEEAVRSATRPAALIIIGALGLVGVVAVVLAEGFSDEGGQFPTIAAGALAALMVVYLTVALVPPVRRRLGGVIADSGGLEAKRSGTADAESPAGRSDEHAPAEASGGAAVSAGGAVAAARPAATTTVVREKASEHRTSDTRSRLLSSIAVVVAFAVTTPFVGLPVTVPLTLLVLLKVIGRESWRTTVVLGGATVLVLYLVFGQLLGVPIEGGSLLDY